MRLHLLDEFARNHHGLVTRSVAAEHGVARSSWFAAVQRGELIRLHPNVARLPGTTPTRQQAILAAILSIGEGTRSPVSIMASHRSAALLLGLGRPFDDPIDITVDRTCQRRLSGVRVHRPTDRLDLTPTMRHGIPTTNELRTLVDLGAVAAGAVPHALDHFTVERRLTLDTLSALLARHSRQGRAGVVALRRAIESWPVADSIPDSVLEIAMARLLIEHRLPPVRFHVRLAGVEVDFHVVGTPVVIECDGWTYHVADRDTWERDQERDATLHAAGFVVLRLTRRMVLFEPERAAERIRALLDRWTINPAS